MNVLALIHGERVQPGIFGQVIEERGHRLEEWSLACSDGPPRPLDRYGAVLVFGGAMHADQDDRHPWLRGERLLLQRLLALRVPVLGVCLGAQLLATAAEAPVGPASEPEVGWYPVELTEPARDDPIFGRLPPRFDAFQWHYYTYGVPACAAELARSRICTQAFRLGESAWGIQFHAEVTETEVRDWVRVAEDGELADGGAAMLAETAARIVEWNELGRSLCSAFFELAERDAP